MADFEECAAAVEFFGHVRIPPSFHSQLGIQDGAHDSTSEEKCFPVEQGSLKHVQHSQATPEHHALTWLCQILANHSS